MQHTVNMHIHIQTQAYGSNGRVCAHVRQWCANRIGRGLNRFSFARSFIIHFVTLTHTHTHISTYIYAHLISMCVHLFMCALVCAYACCVGIDGHSHAVGYFEKFFIFHFLYFYSFSFFSFFLFFVFACC